MKLARPHIPVIVRLQVAERQAREKNIGLSGEAKTLRSKELQLCLLLVILFGERTHEVELHHRPALVNRRRYIRNGKTFYDPPANDPAHLIYLLGGRGEDHDVETRVRGVGAQRSDLAQRRYLKKVVKNRDPNRRKTSIPSRPFPSNYRPLRSRPR